MDYTTIADNLNKPGYESGTVNEDTLVKGICEFTLRNLKPKFEKIKWKFVHSKNLIGQSFFIIFNDIIHLLIYYGNTEFDDVFHNTIHISNIDVDMNITPDFLHKTMNQFVLFLENVEWFYTDSKFTNTNDTIDAVMRLAFSHPTEAIIQDESERYDTRLFDSLVNDVNEHLNYKTIDDAPFSQGVAKLCCDDNIAEHVIGNFESEIQKRDDLIRQICASITNLLIKPNNEINNYQKLRTEYENLRNDHNELVDDYNEIINKVNILTEENQKLKSSIALFKKVSVPQNPQKRATFLDKY
jgi:hypothetical protein